jgi:hypothetical protein
MLNIGQEDEEVCTDVFGDETRSSVLVHDSLNTAHVAGVVAYDRNAAATCADDENAFFDEMFFLVRLDDCVRFR